MEKRNLPSPLHSQGQSGPHTPAGLLPREAGSEARSYALSRDPRKFSPAQRTEAAERTARPEDLSGRRAAPRPTACHPSTEELLLPLETPETALGYISILSRRTEGHEMEVYPKGFKIKPFRKRVTTARPSVHARGKIEGFSAKAAANLRLFLLRNSVPGFNIWNVTLTVPGTVSEAEWHAARKRLSMRAKRAGIAFVWRVELQRRKQPHFHLVAWIRPGSSGQRLFSEHWLASCLPERCKAVKGAWRYCAQVLGPYSAKDASVEWLGYLVGHSGKSKTSQLGWKGKQWGVVSQDLFREELPAVTTPMTDRQRAIFQRALRKLLSVSTGRKHRSISTRVEISRIIDPSRLTRLIQWVSLQ